MRAFAVRLSLAIALGSAAFACDAEPPSAPAEVEEQRGSNAPTVRATSLEQPLPPSATLELPRAALPERGPVRVHLALGTRSGDGAPRPVHVLAAADRRTLELAGRLDASRSVATIEIDPNWLLPGAYLVQVETTEQSHFPLRRYRIVVR
jgi:hypothetical protein